jgi:two-component system, OmpR family, sensor histidine kinase BaeS
MLAFVRSRLWVRALAFFLVASVAPIVGAGVLALRSLEGEVRADAHRRLAALAEIGAAQVRQYLRQGNEKLATVSRLLAKELGDSNFWDTPSTEAELRGAVVKRLDSLVAPSDIYLELQYYAAGEAPELLGVARQAELEPPAPSNENVVDNRGNSLVLEPLHNNRGFTAEAIDTNFGMNSLPISVPVRAAKRAYRAAGEDPLALALSDQEPADGALVAYLDFRRLSERLSAVTEGGYEIALVNGRGAVIARAGALDGEALSARRPAGYSDWQVEVREPAARTYAALSGLRRQVLLGGSVAVILAALLSAALSARISRPVAALTAAAERLAKGELNARAEISRPDEVGRLGAAFDRMADALERLDSAKSEFVGNVSHELRTPLTSIKLSIANLQDGVLGPLDPRQEAALSRLGGDVDRVIALVNTLLELARIEAGAVAPRRAPLELHALCREAAQALEPLAQKKEIAIKVRGEGRALGDPEMLVRVVSNLLDNALKFTPAGGQVAVEVAQGKLTVSDSGPGVELADPFGKFVQGESAGVKHRGAGLGLAISKKLVELMGGEIRLAPREAAGGAVFVVELERVR